MSFKVSVITTTYNDAEHLKSVATKVMQQDYDNLEYIIVNGGEDIETDKVIELVRSRLGDKLKVITGKDTGIYNAINKGLAAATGDVIGCCFDDFTQKSSLRKLVEAIENEGTDGVHADLCYVQDGKIVRRWHQGQGNLRTGWMPGHPTLYLKKEIYEKYGLYKEDYKIAADYEFMVRILWKKDTKLSYVPENLINMQYGGTSNNSLSAYLISLKEGHRALKENGVKFAFITDICRTMRVLFQFVKKS
ncbi:MAG: glycosyltransferase [Lachnospiraceae bacterium]|nr:glycosyltransferase [Candidatus Merdinaster equi]